MGFAAIIQQQQQDPNFFKSQIDAMNKKNHQIAADAAKTLPSKDDKGALVIEDGFQWSGSPQFPETDRKSVV